MIPVIRFDGRNKVVFLDPARRARLKSGAPTEIQIISRNFSSAGLPDTVTFTLLVRIDENVYIGSLADGRLAALHSVGDDRHQFYVTGEPVPDGIRSISDKIASTAGDPPAVDNPLNHDVDVGPEHNVPEGISAMARPHQHHAFD